MWRERVYNHSYAYIVVHYVAAMIGCFLLGIISFYFPIMPLYMALGLEFSNLGPIATAAWALTFDIFVITPLFIYIIIVKLSRNKQQ